MILPDIIMTTANNLISRKSKLSPMMTDFRFFPGNTAFQENNIGIRVDLVKFPQLFKS